MISFKSTDKEEDIRIKIINSILTTPHKDLTKTQGIHQIISQVDPLFYGHFAAWYDKNGEVRDHKVSFISHLLQSEFAEHREAGAFLLQKLPPYLIERVIKYSKQVLRKFPKIGKTAVKELLREMEKDNKRFDGAVVRMRKAMKTLYASCHIKPSKRADDILFKRKFPVNSLPYFVKVLSKEKDHIKQAKLIFEHKIPYAIASTVIKDFSKPILVALINSMSPQEVINNQESLRKRGAFEDRQIERLIEERIKDAIHDKKVSSLKAQSAVKHSKVSKKIKKTLEDVSQKRINKKGLIERPVAIFIDKSPSMQPAIDVAKELCGIVASVCRSNLYVYAFDRDAFPVKPVGENTMQGWRKAFKNMRPSGMTHIGAPLKLMMKDKIYVEQIIIVTDEDDNTTPYFSDAFLQYEKTMNHRPDILILYVDNEGGNTVCHCKLAPDLQKKGIGFERIEYNGDKYSLPNLIPLIAKSSRAEMILEIMEAELPCRKGRKKSIMV